MHAVFFVCPHLLIFFSVSLKVNFGGGLGLLTESRI